MQDAFIEVRTHPQAPLFKQRSMLVLLALGFGGGVPLTMAFQVMPTWASAAQWGVEDIGLLSLATLPYSLKVLWAPLVDRFSIPWLCRLGQRRSWLLASQIACMLMLCVAALCMDGHSESSTPRIMLMLLSVLVFLSATQDIVGDAYRAEILSPREFGAGASVFVTGARIASVVAGAGSLILASRLGDIPAMHDDAWTIAISMLAASMLCGIVGTMYAREPQRAEGISAGFVGAVKQPFMLLVNAWGWKLLALAAFTMIYRLPDVLGGAMTPPLLQQGLGYSIESIGWVRQAMGFGLTIVGTLVGGYMVARFGLIWCLWIFGVLQAASNAGFLILASTYHATVAVKAESAAPVFALVPVIAVESFCSGLVTCGFVAYMMSVCDRRATATQYALLTSFMAIGNAGFGWLSGQMVAHFDYSTFFLLSIVSALPGMALIPVLTSMHRAQRAP